MKRAVQFGAGAIGRGFLGQLYSDAGWETVFVDVVPEVIAALNERRGYTVEIVGPGARSIEVRNVRAIDGRDTGAVAAEVAGADLAGTSVGQSALPAVAKALAAGIAVRAAERPDTTLDVLLCENLLHASDRMRELIEPHVAPAARAYLDERVGLVEAVVSRMIPVPGSGGERSDALDVAAEDYNVLPVDARALRGPAPAVPGIEPVANYLAHEERKLYAHNCGHALAAYLGRLREHEFIWQAVGDEAVLSRVEEGMWEAGRALCRKHGFGRDEHAAHIGQLLTRFANRALGDTVARVGRDPVRKLGPTDRLVGAARLAVEYGEVPRALAEGIAAAMAFRSPGDPSAGALAEMIDTCGVERVLDDVCGLDPGREGDRTIRDLVLEARARTGS